MFRLLDEIAPKCSYILCLKGHGVIWNYFNEFFKILHLKGVHKKGR